MSFPTKSYFSPDRIKQNIDMMTNSILVSPAKKGQNFSNKNMKSDFKDCFYHSKPIKFLCISQNCQNKYLTLCDHEECKSMHSHPDIKIIEVEKFQQFKYQHLKSINLLKQGINKYEKQVIQNIVHKISKDFQLVRNVLDSYYVHKAAKKINEGKFDEIKVKQLKEFIEKFMLISQKLNISDFANTYSSEIDSKYSYLENKFIESKSLMIKTIERISQSIEKLTKTQEYKQITLQQVILNTKQLGNMSPNKSSIKKETFTSKIIQFQEQYHAVVKMLRQNRVPTFQTFELLYRGSQNQFSAQKYHKAVDNKNAIFLIILTETGKKFGAYLNCRTSLTNEWISDPTGISFIYSLDHNQTYRLKPSASFRTKAVFGGNKGPQIGSGCDIYISDRCHQNTQSGSNLGGSYQIPFGLEFNTKKARSHLGGKQNFSIKQYQAYLLI